MIHLVSKGGFKSETDRVKIIVNMGAPQSLRTLHRYLGMVNYLAKFLPNLSDLLHPLHMFTKNEVPWVWSESQQESQDCMKKFITNTLVLAYCDPQ